MDLAFFRRAQATLARRPACLDYRVLVATLEAMQSASNTARAFRAASGGTGPSAGQDPLVELLLGGAGWLEAVRAQGGSFHAGQAERPE